MYPLDTISVLVTAITGIVSMISIVYKTYKDIDRRVREQVLLFFQSEEAQRLIESAIDNSNLSKKVDKLILILCTNDPVLKKSKLCEGT